MLQLTFFVDLFICSIMDFYKNVNFFYQLNFQIRFKKLVNLKGIDKNKQKTVFILAPKTVNSCLEM